MLFLAANRAKLKEDNPELTSAELMKKGAEVSSVDMLMDVSGETC
jgi:hypothetical protein